MLMVAIGHQAGLAIENTVFYNDKIQAERLAAVGQTIATLSHHIKNILQGIRGGSYLIDMGLNEKDDADRPPRLDDRREEPGARSTTWSWTCSRSPRTASRRSSRPT